MKPDLLGMTPDELERQLAAMGEHRYRGRQIAEWLYAHGAARFADMTTLPHALRERLERETRIGLLAPEDEREAPGGGARKYLFRLEDGEAVETVFLILERSMSVCLSTQAGCPVGCAFCATGSIGMRRNLGAGEIIGQFLGVRGRLRQGERITNVVFMGMGEPLLNLENLLRTIRIFTSEAGPSMSPRRITVSTCGIVPGILALERSGARPELAVSVISARERVRAALFPPAARYPLKEVIAAARGYARAVRRPVTFEYVLLKGVNDSRPDAEALGALIVNVPCKVNVIIYNAAPGLDFHPASAERARQFRDWLRPFCRMATVRESRGAAIGAACGQLRAGYASPPGSRMDTDAQR